MALMSYREINEALWRGVRPGHNGTQVSKYASAVNETKTIYTVPAGQTLYLVAWSFSGRNIAAATGFGYFRIQIGGVVLYMMGFYSSATELPQMVTGFHNPPLEVPENNIIESRSSILNLTVYSSFHGWVE